MGKWARKREREKKKTLIDRCDADVWKISATSVSLVIEPWNLSNLIVAIQTLRTHLPSNACIEYVYMCACVCVCVSMASPSTANAPIQLKFVRSKMRATLCFIVHFVCVCAWVRVKSPQSLTYNIKNNKALHFLSNSKPACHWYCI